MGDYKDIPNLKAILGAATSFAWADMTYATSKQIPICNIRNFSTQAVAEMAITIMFNLARQMPRLIKDDFPLDFDKDFMKYRGIELHGKKVGIVGLGHIGSAIAKRCAGLDMEVTYWSRSPKEGDYKRVELDHLMAESDIIFTTMAPNDESTKVLTDDLLRSMKSSAILVDIVHHGLFNHELVLEMIKEDKLFGYGLEVKPASFNDFEGNVWAAPEYAWVTDASMANAYVLWVKNMVDATQGKFPNGVN